MANVVELREMSDDKLEELLENAREELFNLRFQQASARLEDYSRLKHVRREIARLETVLGMRQLAIEAAAAKPEVAKVLTGERWEATARFRYEDSAWRVEFASEDGQKLASALVDLNKKQSGKFRERKVNPASLVISYEIAGAS